MYFLKCITLNVNHWMLKQWDEDDCGNATCILAFEERLSNNTYIDSDVVGSWCVKQQWKIFFGYGTDRLYCHNFSISLIFIYTYFYFFMYYMNILSYCPVKQNTRIVYRTRSISLKKTIRKVMFTRLQILKLLQMVDHTVGTCIN
jgi:hypothetical protein